MRMADILILGGTRNIGHFTALSLLEAGHRVSVLNRGVTPDGLPPQVERLRADRRDTTQMRAALDTLSFDLVLDTTTYNGADARQAVELFGGTADRFIFVSSGQVYLVRENLDRPFAEQDYNGPLMAEPSPDSEDHSEWKYGCDKRDAEDVFTAAAAASGFPLTTLRLPMVASERDDRGRIQCYIARILDRGPFLVPDEPGLPLRHIYVQDIARLVTSLAVAEKGIGRAYNISYGESMSLDELIVKLSTIIGHEVHVIRKPRAELEADKLLPHCSPFSGRWMSELDNTRSVGELGITYTPPEEYLRNLVEDYRSRWSREDIIPVGLSQRQREILAAFPKT